MDKKKAAILAGALAGTWTLASLAALGIGMERGPLKCLHKVYMMAKPGNNTRYCLDGTAQIEHSPLAGLHGAFLGSSVTDGAQSLHESFADFLCRKHGVSYVKEAVNGTTLSTGYKNSYIERMEKNLSPDEKFDFFVCQLSTNDASRKVPLGEIAGGKDRASFDTKTVTGAVEYILSYVKDTWGCPVIFYTGPRFDSPAYEAMVERLRELKNKWDFEIVDLWDPKVAGKVTESEYALYMADRIHPTRAGYKVWWMPVFEKKLIEMFGEKK